MTTSLTQALVAKLHEEHPQGAILYDATVPGLRVVVGKKASSFKLMGKINNPGGCYVTVTLGRTDQVSLKTARAEAQEIRLKLSRGEDPRRVKTEVPTLAQALERYLDSRPDLSPRTKQWYRDKVDGSLKKLKNTRMDAIDRETARALHERLTKNSGAYGANGAMRVLKLLLNDTARTFDLPPNVVTRAVKLNKEVARNWAVSPNDILLARIHVRGSGVRAWDRYIQAKFIYEKVVGVNGQAPVMNQVQMAQYMEKSLGWVNRLKSAYEFAIQFKEHVDEDHIGDETLDRFTAKNFSVLEEISKARIIGSQLRDYTNSSHDKLREEVFGMVQNNAFKEYRDARFLKEFHDDPDAWDQLKSGEEHVANKLARNVENKSTSPKVKISGLTQIIKRAVDRGEGDFDDDDVAELQKAIDIIEDQVHDGVHPYRLAIKKAARTLNKAIRTIEQLLHRFPGAVAIYGATPNDERQGIAQQFQEDPDTRLLIANPAAAGTGFTLTAASYTIYESLSWRYDHYAQSQDRNHRIGQTQPVTYVRLIAADTIEEAVVTALERKSALARSLLGDPGAGEAVARFTQQEMYDLLTNNRLPATNQLDGLPLASDLA